MIRLPDDAPLSPEQRAWLEGFLSKALAGATIPNAPTGPRVPLTILWGSQTGNCEGLAKKLVRRLKRGNFEPEIHDIGEYERTRLVQEKNLLIITSTYGDGEPPDNTADFYEWILGDQAPQLDGLSFSVLALGDADYPDYCKCGVDFDRRLAELGAKRIVDRVDCDVDYDVEFKSWYQAVVEVLSPGALAMISSSMGTRSQSKRGYSKSRPFPAPILQNFMMNKGGARETHHMVLSLEGSGLEYQAGDALGLLPTNPPQVVDEILANLPFNTDTEVPLPDGREVPLREALISGYDIGTINKSMIIKWQARSGAPYLRALVEADDRKAFEDFCWGRDLIDLVCGYPADFSDGEEFVGILKKLQPRLYSIASSPNAHPGKVHLCVAIIRYESHGRMRGGICTTFLADRAKGKTPGVFVHSNKAFRLPQDGDTPVIMVGPGTGIAPFRAFLEERKFSGAKGRNWLLFGNPHESTDFLYQDELETYQRDGVLDRLDLAWSRDQAYKIYVQHLMLENGAELWDWLQQGASFYVCGDASRMAKDVDAALHSIAVEHGGLSEDDAKAFMVQLKRDKRYQRDVY